MKTSDSSLCFARVILDTCTLPPGCVAIALIDRHPTGHADFGAVVVEMGPPGHRCEAAWSGHRFSELPRNWRELVNYELC